MNHYTIRGSNADGTQLVALVVQGKSLEHVQAEALAILTCAGYRCASHSVHQMNTPVDVPILDRITDYLGNGGLFNPEMMEHDKVRNLTMACRDEIAVLRQANAAANAIIAQQADELKAVSNELPSRTPNADIRQAIAILRAADAGPIWPGPDAPDNGPAQSAVVGLASQFYPTRP